MRQPRVRLRTMMAAVAFLALALAVVVQSIRLNQALVREEQIRAQVEVQRAQAEIQYRQARDVLDQMTAGIAERQQQPPAVAPEP